MTSVSLYSHLCFIHVLWNGGVKGEVKRALPFISLPNPIDGSCVATRQVGCIGTIVIGIVFPE